MKSGISLYSSQFQVLIGWIFLEGGYWERTLYKHPYKGSRESSEDFEIVPLAGKHELGWLGLM